jgi:hypothetical protein
MDEAIKTDWNKLLVKASGLALVTVALTWLPTVFGALAQIIFSILYWPDAADSDPKLNEVLNQVNATLLTTAIGKVVSFVVLVLLARWIMSYPRFIQSWISKTDTAERKQAEQGSAHQSTTRPESKFE